MEHGPTENLREKLEIHKRWLNERLQNTSSHIDSQEDDIELRQTQQTQQTGSFRGHRRDVSAPPVRNDKLFVLENEHPEDVEEDDYREHYQNYRDDSTLGLNQSNATAHTNERERFNNKSNDRSQDRSMDMAKPPKRWEALYNLNRKNLQMKEQISKELENKEIDSECTFQPKIRNSHVNQSLLHPLSIHERNKLWKERKEAKLAMTRETGKDRDLEGCTFQPRVSPRKRNESFSGMTNYQTKGIEKYLRRQVVARKIKEEKEMILDNPLCRLPENAIRKEGKVTIPRGPKFVEKTQAFDISSLKKPLNPPHLSKVTENSFYGGKRNSITPLGERSRNESLYWQENNNDHSYYNNEYSQVLQSLHDELHNFEIRYE